MKKAIYSMTFFGVFTLLFVACDKESVVPPDGLPSNAQHYVSEHFPNHEILQVVKERDDLKTSYEVFLSDGYQIEFNKRGDVLSVEGTGKLPDTVVPEKI